ncbi:MAG: undecaprenyl/decaprenyl-phosphate alpha-N-acetylglucosaminyl 1-phosphate transferase [Solirubrobacteraceae bacterium]|nr:undecaprenyl/decaprenyl-phosphate alpha-N-acetylglucosaminyl 1-phosphate transferase [Solirubrobacteraceae bacterium]
MDALDAVLGFVAAGAAAAALTPLTARFARAVGAVDRPRERGLAERPTPLLGGLAILAGVLFGCALFLRWDQQLRGILAGAALITLVGAIDDRFDLPPLVKLVGQVVAAIIPVASGVTVENVTLPFIGPLDFGGLGAPLTVLGLVAVMNVVNFSDGIDGLAAGVCAIAGVTFAIIAFDLHRDAAGVLAAIVGGAALGFLFWNFHPASVFMGDAGALLLGLLLGCVAVQGSLKTNAILALIFPLLVLTVPFLDTTFVVLKRMKYRRPVYSADRWHLHHRLANIGFSQRRAVLYLYAWTLIQAGLALALRFVPYSENDGTFRLGWSLVMIALGLVALAASVYLVYVLEILKFRRLLRRRRPEATDEEVARHLETGEFDALDDPGPGRPGS